MSTFTNRSKGSSHPLRPGGTYVGVVRSLLPNNFLSIYIPRLDTVYSPVEFLPGIGGLLPRPNDKIICSFLNNGTTDIVAHSFSQVPVAPKIIQINVDTAVLIDSFSVYEFSAIKYEIFVAQEDGGRAFGSLSVVATASDVDVNYYGESSINFDGTLGFSDSAVSANICEVKAELSTGDVNPAEIKIARSFWL